MYASIGDQELFPNGLYLEKLIDELDAAAQVSASLTVYDYAVHGQVWERGLPDGIAAAFGGGEE